LRDMINNQEDNYKKLVATQEVRIRRRFVHQPYLGILSKTLTRRAQDLIAAERSKGAATLEKAGTYEAVDPCDETCSTWRQYRLPCLHTILEHFKDGNVVPLTLYDVDKR